jgi:hypothetical protein
MLETSRAPAGLLSALAAVYALFAAALPVERGPIVCPFRMLTGHRCPLCGLTRATRALTRGELRNSVSFHPLAPFLWAILIAWSVIAQRRIAARGAISSP